MLRKLLSISLAMAMLSVTAFAEDAVPAFQYADSKITAITEADGTVHSAELTPWTGGVAESVSTIEIDGAPYYQVANGDDLRWFAEFVNSNTQIAGADTAEDTTDDIYSTSANAILVSDIDMGGKNWQAYRFENYTGIFNGQNHTIYNLSVRTNAKMNTAMFSSILGGEVKNLRIENADIAAGYDTIGSNTSAAVICGEQKGGKISNVRVRGKISVQEGKYANSAGSFVGKMMYDSIIENCYSDVEIDMSAGGTEVKEYSASAADYGIGGIVGYIHENSGSETVRKVLKCGFAGSINAPYSSRVGGIVGSAKSGNPVWWVKDCYNKADITAYRQVAGIIGWVYNGKYQQDAPGTFENNYNTGDIVAKCAENTYAAGIVNGMLAKSTTGKSYSSGNVTVIAEGALEFNDTCALAITNLSTTKSQADDYDALGSRSMYAYVNAEGETVYKHVGANAGGTKEGTSNNSALKGNFTNSEKVYSKLEGAYIVDVGINNKFPILPWEATSPLTACDEYLISKNSGLSLSLDSEEKVVLKITPLGGSVNVTVNGETKEISKAGTYSFETGSTAANVSADGIAIIKEAVMNQQSGKSVEKIEAGLIRVNIESDKDASIFLALFKGRTLEKIVFLEDVKVENGYISGVIDLTEISVSGRTLKAFAWENGIIKPIKDIQKL